LFQTSRQTHYLKYKVKENLQQGISETPHLQRIARETTLVLKSAHLPHTQASYISLFMFFVHHTSIEF